MQYKSMHCSRYVAPQHLPKPNFTIFVSSSKDLQPNNSQTNAQVLTRGSKPATLLLVSHEQIQLGTQHHPDSRMESHQICNAKTKSNRLNENKEFTNGHPPRSHQATTQATKGTNYAHPAIKHPKPQNTFYAATPPADKKYGNNFTSPTRNYAPNMPSILTCHKCGGLE